MAAKDHDIPIALLNECAQLNGDDALWRERPLAHFGGDARTWKTWNTRWAGKPVGSITAARYRETTLCLGGKKYRIRVHRLLWALKHGRWPSELLDHENGARDDNRLGNLREATHTQNNQNQSLHSANTSGFIGVTRHTQTGRNQAQIRFQDGHHIFLGLYDDPQLAFRIYLAAKAILHPFAPTPRGVPVPDLHALDRMRAAHRIVKAARRRGDDALELDAWDAFVAAM